MATSYTSILKLALPVAGELNGTWGDTVNDNITSMIEEAIAGLATIDAWVDASNTHNLTTANGTTSESRCAILELTDTTTDLSGAGTLVCPTKTKMYIVKNGTGQTITIKTSGGSGVAIADGITDAVYCDGTNVVQVLTGLAKYGDTTANFTGTLQNGGSNVLVDTDIGSTVQAYDADLTSLAGASLSTDAISSLTTDHIATLNDTAIQSIEDATLAVGDILYALNTDQLTTLNVGTSGQVLTLTSDQIPAWSSAAGGGIGEYAGTGNILVSQSGTAGDNLGSGSNNIYLGDDAGTDNSSGANNVGIGAYALVEATSHYNTAVGYGAGRRIRGSLYNVALGYNSVHGDPTNGVTGNSNTGIGQFTLYNLQSGQDNVAIGDNAVKGGGTFLTGSSNIGIGKDSLYNATTGKLNIAIGGVETTDTTHAVGALNALTTGNYNIALGYKAGDAITTESKNIAIGYLADGAGTDLISIGSQAGHAGTRNVHIGLQGGQWCTGSYNTTLGTFAGDALTSGNSNTSIGYQADGVATADNQTAIGNGATCTKASQIVLGNSSVVELKAGNYVFNIDQTVGAGEDNYVLTYDNATGEISLEAAGGGGGGIGEFVNTDNICISDDSTAGTAITSGTNNILLGSGAGDAISSGANNVAIGFDAGSAAAITNNGVYIGASAGLLSTGDGTVAIGANAVKDAAGVSVTGVGLSAVENMTGQHNTGVGYEALKGAAAGATGTYNVGAGYQAGLSLTSGSYNVLMGYQAGDAIDTGGKNVCIGAGAGTNITGAGETVCIGYEAGKSATTESNYIGYWAGRLNTGSRTNAFGHEAASNGSGAGNAFFGNEAGKGASSGCTGTYNIAMGWQSLHVYTTADYTVSLGYQAGQDTTTADYNVLLGYKAGTNITEGGYNIAIGAEAMGLGIVASAGVQNICMGYRAGYNLTSGISNIAIGKFALHDNTTGKLNIAIGGSDTSDTDANATLGNCTGNNNIAIGYYAGDAVTSGYWNTMIGNNTDAAATGNNQTSLGHGAICTASDQITLGDANVTDLRCYDTSISSPSDIRDKKDVVDIPYGLDFINDLRPVTFEWDHRDTDEDGNQVRAGRKEVGFIAQEMDAVEVKYMSNDYTHIVHKDTPERWEVDALKTYPIMVKAIQELTQQVKDLQNEIATLKGE